MPNVRVPPLTGLPSSLSTCFSPGGSSRSDALGKPLSPPPPAVEPLPGVVDAVVSSDPPVDEPVVASVSAVLVAGAPDVADVAVVAVVPSATVPLPALSSSSPHAATATRDATVSAASATDRLLL